MRKIVPLKIMPDDSAQVLDGWQVARQRDFTGGENQANLPEMVKRNQLVRMENVIISPEGEITDCWQMDTPLFINVSSGIVITPIPGSSQYTVYAVTSAGIESFVFDPNSPVPYDLAAASSYPGYQFHAHANPISLSGINNGVPYLGKNYCIAATNVFILAGELTASSTAFGTVQTMVTETLDVTITNTTASTVTISGLNFIGTDAVCFGCGASFPFGIAAGSTAIVQLTFTPPTEGVKTATLNITANIGILQVNVTGTADNMLVFSISSLDLTGLLSTGVSSLEVKITNNGPRQLNASIIKPLNYVTSLNRFMAIWEAGESPQVLAPNGGFLWIRAYYYPLNKVELFSTLVISTELGTRSIPMTGNAV